RIANNPKNAYLYVIEGEKLNKIPGNPITYWISEIYIDMFSQSSIEENTFHISKGIYTGKNDYFIRAWYEINYNQFNKNWIIYAKGGTARSWYGNYIELLNWKDDGKELKQFKGSGTGPVQYFGKENIVWAKIGSS